MRVSPLRRGLVAVGVLRWRWQRTCQHQAGDRRTSRNEFPSHSVPQGGQRQQSALRSLLVRIHVRLHLQIVQYVKIRVEILIFVEGL
jgi:hypothetical protein